MSDPCAKIDIMNPSATSSANDNSGNSANSGSARAEPVASESVPCGDMPLSGKVALITGAGRGIGRAIAERFAQAGATVVCSARTERQIDEVAAAIVASGGQAVAIPADVGMRESVNQLVAQTLDAFGRLDILAANAGAVHPFQLADGITDQDWQRMIDVNLSGVHFCATAAAKALETDGGGHIMVMGSGQGHRPSEGLAGYCASKAAVAMYVRVLALELRSKGITVNELVPGPVRTELLADLLNQPLEALHSEDFQIMGDWVKNPADVAEYALFLAAQPTYGASGQRFSMLRRDG